MFYDRRQIQFSGSFSRKNLTENGYFYNKNHKYFLIECQKQPKPEAFPITWFQNYHRVMVHTWPVTCSGTLYIRQIV